MPPDDVDTASLYRHDWEWDLTPLAAFKQELEALQAAEDDGLISRSDIQKTMFQLDPAKVDMERAREEARARAIAKIADQLEAEADASIAAELAASDM